MKTVSKQKRQAGRAGKYAAGIAILAAVLAVAGLLFLRHKDGKYSVTQYASVTGRQAMIYTITDREGHLVVIDGGWREDAGQLLSIINEQHDGHVDAWILTPPHPDHIGAFNEIYASGQVEIDKIYTVPVDYEIYKGKAQEWDEFSVYEEFVRLTEGEADMSFLREGEILDLIGLKMEVFHSFDSQQMAEVKDPCNDGGMIFRLSTERESMLFLADVGVGQSDYILNQYGERLKSDYVQMGHHGNGGMDERVYQKISPREAFFDIPEGMMQDERLNAGEKRALMDSLGAKIHYYATAPNVIKLK